MKLPLLFVRPSAAVCSCSYCHCCLISYAPVYSQMIFNPMTLMDDSFEYFISKCIFFCLFKEYNGFCMVCILAFYHTFATSQISDLSAKYCMVQCIFVLAVTCSLLHSSLHCGSNVRYNPILVRVITVQQQLGVQFRLLLFGPNLPYHFPLPLKETA